MLFTCPSRYSSTIGHTGVFRLGGWSPRLHASLLGSKALLRNSTTPGPSPSPTGLSPSSAPRSRGVRLASPVPSAGPTTPGPRGTRFGLRPFRSPLLGASRLISLPPGTEMFQFPGFASPGSPGDGRSQDRPGCPIRPPGDHGVCAPPPGLSQLTAAFLASVCPGIPHVPSLA